MRPLRRIPVPPGAAGLAALAEPLSAALDGSGAAIAPVPTTSVTVSNTYIDHVLAALRPDDPTAPLESDEVAVVLATSGSTGRPRGVLLTAPALQALSPHITAPGAQWIAALPVTSMGGFNVMLRALASGREPVAVASIGGGQPFTPAAFADAVQVAAQRSSDLRVSLVAAQVRRLLEDPAGVGALRACSQILVGGGRLPEPLRAAAGAAGITLTSTYGATETSGGCVYDGRPLPGVGVDLDDQHQVLLRGPMLALGYRGEPSLTRQRFTAHGYRTGDVGALADDGTLTIVGRADDIVVVNGVNVSLAAIEQVVEQVPGVAGCAVLAVDDGEHEPQIVVVAAGGDTVDADAISAAVVERLGRAAVPLRVAQVTHLPASANGKVDRQRLRQAAAEGSLPWLR